jgi:hypothetical protein
VIVNFKGELVRLPDSPETKESGKIIAGTYLRGSADVSLRTLLGGETVPTSFRFRLMN